MRQRQCAREFRRDRQNVRGLCEGTEGYCGGTALWGLKGTERYSTRGFGRGRQGVRDRGNDLRRGARWPDRTQQLTPGIQRTHVMQRATDRGHTTRTCPRPHNTPRRVACRTLLVACRNFLVASLIIRHAFSMSLLTWLQVPREPPHSRVVPCCLLFATPAAHAVGAGCAATAHARRKVPRAPVRRHILMGVRPSYLFVLIGNRYCDHR
jgi:hypothetical protein